MVDVVIWVACLTVVAVSLCLAAASDLGSRTIPNGCVAAVIAARLPVLSCCEERRIAVADSAMGFSAVFLLLLVCALISRRATGSCGIGGGDLKLLSALGCWAGPVGGLAIVGVSCLVALLGRVLVRRAREASSYAALCRGAPLPLAPSILAGSALTFVAGLWL